MSNHIMDQLLTEAAVNAIQVFMPGTTVPGIVIDSSPSRILVQLPGGVTGIVTKKEATGFGVTTDDYEVGTPIEAMVIQSENEQGLVMLSLRRASQEMVWAELHECFEESRIIKVKVTDANKGGLMTLYKGLKAFLPVSQLTPLNYPRVDGADAGEILRRLQSHAGSEMAVRVINADRERGKLIVSEKEAVRERQDETLKSVKAGDIVTGQVCGIVKFGIFVTFGGAEGLVHLSELDWGHVSDPGKNFELGQKVEVLVLGVEGKKLSFSIKRLTDDPWKDQVKAFTIGQTIAGKVIRWNSNGIFIAISDNVNGLFPLEDYNVENHSDLKVREGETRTGEIVEIDYNSHRLVLKESGETQKTEEEATE